MSDAEFLRLARRYFEVRVLARQAHGRMVRELDRSHGKYTPESTKYHEEKLAFSREAGAKCRALMREARSQ